MPPSDPIIRPATTDDLPAIIALLADDVLGRTREDASMPPADAYVRAFDAMMADGNQIQVVADRDGVVVGTLQVTIIPGLSRMGQTRGQIEGVRVAASERGAGLGEALIRWAIEACRTRGCALVQLTTDRSRTDAHRFYDRLGFTASHLGYKLTL
ncbi:acetyltransferase [Tistrella bauzanensis]|uniref:Acetyltransferase n=1 Tax=Tistrella bauzanensis TaxID=657419 RepID=A0ABQ1IG08_9PROT|nr:GNAT family N-acetyltransferase [Tistrella bauzanensis]GGB37434.1 acetyltransferase [Tistrella bauzanensis]